MRLGHRLDSFRRKTTPLERHHVDAARPGRKPLAEHERGNVVKHAGEACHKRPAADRGPVMDGDCSRQRRAGVHANMTAQQRAVGQNAVVADATVVRHMAAGHQEVAAADRRHAILFFSGAIDRDAFPDDVAVADLDPRPRAAVAQVLRLPADDGIGKDSVLLADPHVARDGDVVLEHRAPTDHGIRRHPAEGADRDIPAELCPRLDNGRRMNHGRQPPEHGPAGGQIAPHRHSGLKIVHAELFRGCDGVRSRPAADGPWPAGRRGPH